VWPGINIDNIGPKIKCCMDISPIRISNNAKKVKWDITKIRK
jgi:hypothetical protein